MAMSNSNVANRVMQFVSDHMQGKAPTALKSVQGSNFCAWLNSTQPSYADFDTIATIISYRTEIARVVVNRANPEPIYELWVTTEYYSSTTNAQQRHLLAAHREFIPKSTGKPLPLYRVSLEHPLPHRCNGSRLERALVAARRQRDSIDRRNIRAATRLEHLQHAIVALDNAIHTTSTDVPRRTLECFVGTTEYLARAMDMRAELATLEPLTVDEMRVAVRAMVALEQH